MEDNKDLIELTGSASYTTYDPKEVLTVESGEANVYMQFHEGDIIDRSLFLRDVKEGDKIPGLSCRIAGSENKWHFVVIPKKNVTLRKSRSEDENHQLGNEFADSVENFPQMDETNYQKRFARWYIDIMNQESAGIHKMRQQKERDINANFDLMESLFKNRRILKYEFSTDSALYNTVSVLCDYMNIPLIPYQRLLAVKGPYFTIPDMARLSHFVTRTVTLQENWFTKDAGSFIAFMKEDKKPVLCIPKNSHTYMMYDLENRTEKIVEEEEAAALESTAYIIYRHLPGKKQSLKDVLVYGARLIRTRDIVVFVIMYTLSVLVGLAMPFLNEKLYDELIPLGVFTPILQVGLVIFVVMLGNMFFDLVRNLASFRAVKTMEYAIVEATYDRIFKLPQRFIERFGTIELVNRVSSVTGVFSQTVTTGVSAVLGFILSFFYLFKMFDKSKTLAWRGLFMALISGVVMYVFGYLRVSREKEKLVASTKANGMLYQFLTGILKVKVGGMENRSLYEFQKANVESMKYDMRSTTISNAGSVFSAIMTVAYSAIIYYVVVKKKQSLSIGEYTAFSSAYGLFTSAVSQLVNFFVTQANLTPVMDRIRPIFDEPAEVYELSPTAKALQGEVSIDHLSFAYDEDEPNVLTDINIHIKPGEYIGIVGPSGCGKSTLLKLLLGFETATSGNIFYDNRDIESLEKTEMRRQMGAVLQDGKMVVGNIYTNITLSAPNLEPSDVLPLLEEVGLAEDVAKMPMGMFTSISEGGGTVSGGQQQRILIARALANDPVILYLDEATSALDNITQQKVCENMARRNMTRVMIAHRLSTVKNCDRIYVMNEGRIVETGSYDELMELNGLFCELVRRQELGNG
ncbi:MAG: NHLP bacteriocin export ABC transporter permease/ATPase subunit [Lachnospiraceae bacterium]|nr:NHLP bacteriocin export ABC transporter permease/ATPase subunit [Lachnospiraceae bacterium]